MEIKISNPFIGKEEINAVIKVLKSGNLASGNVVSEFEREFKEYIGVKHVVAVSSGTSALLISLLALGIGPGDEVITTAFTFRATIETIIFCGALPKLVDIDPSTYNINPDLIEQAITKRTRAILPVHLYGLPCDMNSIMRIAKKHNLKVIEDCAQAHGASIAASEVGMTFLRTSQTPPMLYRGRGRGRAQKAYLPAAAEVLQKVGSIGDAGCFSFYATKNMTTGEGGMITTNNDELFQNILRIIKHEGKLNIDLLDIHFRMTDIQAALGRVQLKRLDRLNRIRIKNANFYKQKLSTVKGLICPKVPEGKKHVFHQYTVKINDNYSLSREMLLKKLEQAGIQARIYYPQPIHKLSLFTGLFTGKNLSRSEQVAKEVLSLPIHPKLNIKQLKSIVNCLKNDK